MSPSRHPNQILTNFVTKLFLFICICHLIFFTHFPKLELYFYAESKLRHILFESTYWCPTPSSIKKPCGYLGQRLIPDLRMADPLPGGFTLSCKLFQSELTSLWNKANTTSFARSSDPILTMKFCLQKFGTKDTLVESNSDWELVQLTANDADQVLALLMQGTNSSHEGVRYLTLLKHYPQHFPRDKVKSTTHSGWLDKLSCTPRILLTV